MIVEDQPEDVGKGVIVTCLKMCLGIFGNPNIDVTQGASDTKREWCDLWHAISYVAVARVFEIDNAVRWGMPPTFASLWLQN